MKTMYVEDKNSVAIFNYKPKNNYDVYVCTGPNMRVHVFNGTLFDCSVICDAFESVGYVNVTECGQAE